MLSRKDTCHTFDIEENNLQQNAVIIILREEDGLLRELTPGTTGSENFWLGVVLADIGDIIAYRHGLHFCQEVYPYRNQNKV